MPRRKVNLLHIEDEAFQRVLAARLLASVDDHEFAIRHVEDEEAAIVAFAEGGVDLVLLDYYLARGDGASCLLRLRRLDRLVPIIAISGASDPEVAAELLRLGADGYIDKRGLSGRLLDQTVRDALARADSWRERLEAEGRESTPAPTEAGQPAPKGRGRWRAGAGGTR
jgi:DNA-binding NarL/FixJ family response regulator